MLSGLLKKLLYHSGALGLYHRARNADSLTVVMFHRVLDERDPRWASCDPDYTLPVGVLERSLAFFARHYNVVSVEQVLEARRTGGRLPPRALLITFDDGWADNADYALPALERAGLPGLMFVVSDAVGRTRPFYQESLIGAWRRGAIRVAGLAGALRQEGVALDADPAETIAGLRTLIAKLEGLAPGARDRVLVTFAGALDDGLRCMVDVGDLERLETGGIALGLHGKTHIPMTSPDADVDAELAGARAALAERMRRSAGPTTMSFPHGAYDDAIAQRARAAGYELVFTSVPVLNRAAPGVGWLLGRTGFDAEGALVDARGRFHPEWMALDLFRKPLATLS